MPTLLTTNGGNGLSVAAYTGDGAVLLAFDLKEDITDKLAGFSIHCATPTRGPYRSNEYWLKNRLSFTRKLTKSKVDSPQTWTPSDKAPFQMFHWVHFPGAGPGEYTYTVQASYFANGDTGLRRGPQAVVKANLSYQAFPDMELGFTRGFVSSQAYNDRFDQRQIRPKQKSIDYDTTRHQDQYEWLGAHGRRIIFRFLQECLDKPSLNLDVFAYDLDEPDIIRQLAKVGPRLRILLDDSARHRLSTALEQKAARVLERSGAQLKRGHFGRFSHNKVMIQKEDNRGLKALTGSANFSVRGLYVQANSVIVFSDPDVAKLYEDAFSQAFTAPTGFRSSPIASKWYELTEEQTPRLFVSFAPHRTPFTLDKVSEAVKGAKSSVLFSVMQMTGKGWALQSLKDLGDRSEIYSLGTIESKTQLKLFRPGIDANSSRASFSYLKESVPDPFKQEWSGGSGQVIHHKFIVCDFNGRDPVVFCGSSNLASGGETSNSDNLIAVFSREIAAAYAVEAIRLFDHYRFRNLHERSTTRSPLTLKETDEWTRPYYDRGNIKFRERQLLASAHP